MCLYRSPSVKTPFLLPCKNYPTPHPSFAASSGGFSFGRLSAWLSSLERQELPNLSSIHFVLLLHLHCPDFLKKISSRSCLHIFTPLPALLTRTPSRFFRSRFNQYTLAFNFRLKSDIAFSRSLDMLRTGTITPNLLDIVRQGGPHRGDLLPACNLISHTMYTMLP